MKFTVDKKTWSNSNSISNLGDENILLLSPKGNRCCLGFVCNQLGVSDEILLNKSQPSEVINSVTILTKKSPYTYSGSVYNSSLALDAISINDDLNLNEEQMIEELTDLFEKNGHQIEFV